MDYEIKLDFVNYRQYTGNIERELTDFIFGSKWNLDYWKVPRRWEDRLLEFQSEHDGIAINTLCAIEGKVYDKDEVKKFKLEGESYKGAPKNYHCFRIFWRFELEGDQKAKNMAGFLVRKSQKFMQSKLKKSGYRKRSRKPREIPTEIYCLEKRLVQ